MTVCPRHGADRVLRYAYELARSRERKQLTVATKSNGIAVSMLLKQLDDVAQRNLDLRILGAHC